MASGAGSSGWYRGASQGTSRSEAQGTTTASAAMPISRAAYDRRRVAVGSRSAKRAAAVAPRPSPAMNVATTVATASTAFPKTRESWRAQRSW